MTEKRFWEIIEEIYFNKFNCGSKPAQEILNYIKELEQVKNNIALDDVSNTVCNYDGLCIEQKNNKMNCNSKGYCPHQQTGC